VQLPYPDKEDAKSQRRSVTGTITTAKSG